MNLYAYLLAIFCGFAVAAGMSIIIGGYTSRKHDRRTEAELAAERELRSPEGQAVWLLRDWATGGFDADAPD